MTMIDALQLLAAGSPAAVQHVGKAMQLLAQEDTRRAQAYYNKAAIVALNDSAATFTAEQRRAIARLMGPATTGKRERVLQVRLTTEEWGRVRERAVASGRTLSDYARRRLLQDDAVGGDA